MGSSVIFSGTKVKTLKSTIDLNGGNDIISSSTNPQSVAVSANIGSLLLNTSSGKLYRKNDPGSSTNWTEVGASGQAGINYISNPNAATDTTGWATYADAAGSAPVDGTGGSPNVTWTRQTSSALRGAADFRFIKDAVNRQGQGVSIDFTIDNADIAKLLTVTFDYELISGTYATGDLTVYLIADPAVTPVVIQPAGYQIQSATASTKMRNIATFQTQASGTSYRLCFHVASTSASAYTIDIDNVVVGPQVVQYGAPITDFTSFTPTGSWSTNSTYTGWWARQGDSAIFKMRVATSGAPTAATLTFNIPFGWSIDTAKIPNNTSDQGLLGQGAATDNGVSTYPVGVYSAGSATSVRINAIAAGGTYGSATAVNATVPFTFGSGDMVDVTFAVPIVGWSSTVVMSNDTDTRVVGAFYRASANCGGSTTQDINFDTKMYDTHGAVTPSAAGTGSWKFTAPVPGLYSVKGNLAFTAATQSEVQLFKNGTLYQKNIGWVIAANGQGSFVAEVELLAGDYIAIRTSASITVVGGALNTTIGTISVHRLSGPSAIAASETVSAAYHIASGAGQSVANTGSTIINYGNKVFDSHNAVTTGASWKFTAPVAGKYQVNASLYYLSSAYSIGNIQYLDIFKNGVYLTGGPATTAQTTTSVLLSEGVSSIISLNAGDYIDIRANNNRTAGATTTGDGVSAAISIVKVGI